MIILKLLHFDEVTAHVDKFLFNVHCKNTRLSAGIYLLKVSNRNTGTRCEICSKLTIKTPPERRNWRRSGVFVVNFEHISQLVLVFLLSTLKRQLPGGLGCSSSSKFFTFNLFYVNAPFP